MIMTFIHVQKRLGLETFVKIKQPRNPGSIETFEDSDHYPYIP